MRRWLVLFRIAVKNILLQPSLSGARLLGIILVGAIMGALPIYADAVQFRVLQEKLSKSSLPGSTEESPAIVRPPFAFLYQYVGSWRGPVEWEAVEQLNVYMTTQAGNTLGLPVDFLVTFASTDVLYFYGSQDTGYADPGRSLGMTRLAYASDFAAHIKIVEGAFPSVANAEPTSVIPVLVSEPMANDLGLMVGDQLYVVNQREPDNPYRVFPVQVAGVWVPENRQDPYWFYTPEALLDHFFVPEETYAKRIAPWMLNETNLALWYMGVDGSQVGVNNVDTLVYRADQLLQNITAILPYTKDAVTPVDGLRSYQRAVAPLLRLLTAFSVPVVGLLLAFSGMMATLALDQQRNLIAVSRSRGGSAWQMLGLSAIESSILAGIAYPLALGAAILVAQAMGHVRSFLEFSGNVPLRTQITPGVLATVLAAVGGVALLQVLPVIQAARHTVITYKQERARALQPPWWQRAWLEAWLLIPTGYGLYTLQSGKYLNGIAAQAAQADTASSALVTSDPLLLLLPALMALTAALFCLRVIAWLMETLARGLTHTESFALLSASRNLARAPGGYAAALALVIMTMSLSIFTASLAKTLDDQVYDEGFYRTGADVNLTGAGLVLEGRDRFAPPGSTAAQGVFLPMSDYLELPDVVAATRVGRYTAVSQVSTDKTPGLFLGIDRRTFMQVAYWRYDFSQEHLGTLMNALASHPEAVLVSRDFLENNQLAIGDFFRLEVMHSDQLIRLYAQVVGVVDYFPTWYVAKDGPLIVGNLDTLFEQVGGELPYQVWLKTGPGYDPLRFEDGLYQRGMATWFFREPHTNIQKQLSLPERQGLFGVLTIGFMAASLVTILGYFLYAIFTFRRRFIELGVLRAIGVSTRQMTIMIAFELAALVLSGLGLGALLGIWISRSIIPHLQVELVPLVPPYLVELSWTSVVRVAILFGVLFAGVLAALAASLRRLKIFQAVKLGETV